MANGTPDPAAPAPGTPPQPPPQPPEPPASTPPTPDPAVADPFLGWPAEAKAAVEKANAEAAQRRHELRETEAEREKLRESIKEREDAERTELEKAQARAEELEEQSKAKDLALRKANLTVRLANPELGIAADAIDIVAGILKVEYDENGEPIDVAKAVEELLEARPSLRARGPAGDQTSAGNPASGRSRGGEVTKEEARRLATEDPAKLNALIDEGKVPSGIFGS